MPQASDYGSSSGPRGGFWDYSASMQADFAATVSPYHHKPPYNAVFCLADPRRCKVSGCVAAVPSPKTMDTPTAGNSWLDGSLLSSRCAIAWSRFMSASVARAINVLGHAVKDQSDERCLVFAYLLRGIYISPNFPGLWVNL